jgi:hypothetical protein
VAQQYPPSTAVAFYAAVSSATILFSLAVAAHALGLTPWSSSVYIVYFSPDGASSAEGHVILESEGRLVVHTFTPPPAGSKAVMLMPSPQGISVAPASRIVGVGPLTYIVAGEGVAVPLGGECAPAGVSGLEVSERLRARLLVAGLEGEAAGRASARVEASSLSVMVGVRLAIGERSLIVYFEEALEGPGSSSRSSPFYLALESEAARVSGEVEVLCGGERLVLALEIDLLDPSGVVEAAGGEGLVRPAAVSRCTYLKPGETLSREYSDPRYVYQLPFPGLPATFLVEVYGLRASFEVRSPEGGGGLVVCTYASGPGPGFEAPILSVSPWGG